MRDHHALGPPSAAGREDDVGEVLAIRRTRRGSPDRFPLAISRRGSTATIRPRTFRKPVAQMVVGHQHGRSGIPQNRREPLGGMVRVERQVSPARLQDAQETDDPGRPLGRGRGPRPSPAARPARSGDGRTNWTTDSTRRYVRDSSPQTSAIASGVSSTCLSNR